MSKRHSVIAAISLILILLTATMSVFAESIPGFDDSDQNLCQSAEDQAVGFGSEEPQKSVSINAEYGSEDYETYNAYADNENETEWYEVGENEGDDVIITESNDGVLTVSGNGNMMDFGLMESPFCEGLYG